MPFIYLLGYTPPAYADDYYGYGASHGSDIDQQMTDIQATATTDDDDEHDLATPSDDEETANLTPEELSQLQFDQDVMVYYRSVDSALASEFLNPDALNEDLPCIYQVTTDGSQSPASSSATSPSLGTPAEADIAQFSNRPLDSSLLDGGDFDAFPIFGNTKNTAGWPWGDFTYRPRTPEQYLDPVEYLMEDQLREEEAIAREELSELMLQQAIRDGVRETRREERPERRERRKRVKIDHPTTRAFNNQVIRGRTIYNP